MAVVVSKRVPKLYFWDKYTAEETPTYTYQVEEGSGPITAPPNYSGSKSYAKTDLSTANASGFTKTGTLTLPGNWGNSDSPESYVKGKYLLASGYGSDYDSDGDEYLDITYVNKSSATYAVYISRKSSGHWRGIIYKSVPNGTVLVQGTYVGEVGATRKDAYPENGVHTDGYWYVRRAE